MDISISDMYKFINEHTRHFTSERDKFVKGLDDGRPILQLILLAF